VIGKAERFRAEKFGKAGRQEGRKIGKAGRQENAEARKQKAGSVVLGL